MSAKALAAMSRAADRMQPALRLLGQLRAAMGVKLYAEAHELADQLEAALYQVEASVGVVTQPSLFEPGLEGPDGAPPGPDARPRGLAKLSELWLVDCDKCGRELSVQAPAGQTSFEATCPHCGHVMTCEE